jgi:hypothetical protein
MRTCDTTWCGVVRCKMLATWNRLSLVPEVADEAEGLPKKRHAMDSTRSWETHSLLFCSSCRQPMFSSYSTIALPRSSYPVPCYNRHGTLSSTCLTQPITSLGSATIPARQSHSAPPSSIRHYSIEYTDVLRRPPTPTPTHSFPLHTLSTGYSRTDHYLITVDIVAQHQFVSPV